jgi:hypothetical protein
MSNRYHLVVETPNANLVAGMAWLESAQERSAEACHRRAVAAGSDIILESHSSHNRIGQFQKCKCDVTSMDGTAGRKCAC